MLFKKELVKQFYEMRRLLFEKQSAEWIETRKQSKIVRNSLTDVIKELAEYAKGQGSKHSDKLYVTYSKLANKVANIDKRDNASIIQLNMLSTAENIIYKAIVEGIQAGKNYKDIYKESKKRLELFKSIAYIEPSTNNENVLKNNKLLAM